MLENLENIEELNKAVEKRCSRSFYNKKPIKQTEEVKEIIKKANIKTNISFEYIQDKGEYFEKFEPLYGGYKNVKNIILARASRNDENAKEEIGYYGELIILELTNLGLGTNWVALSLEKPRFKYDKNQQELVAIITFGNIENTKSSIEKSMHDMLHQYSPKEKEVFTINFPATKTIEAGIKAVMKAPSAMNKMKPRYEISNGIIKVKVKDDYYTDKIDLGISKLHFEIGTNGAVKFPLGNNIEVKY